jgi:hypothetical protein
MATVTATMGKLLRTNEVCDSPVAATTFSANDTVKIPCTSKPPILLIQPSTTGNVVFSKGDGMAAVNDQTVAVTASKDNFIMLDTAIFGNKSGANKGYIIMTPAVAGSLSLINTL